VGRVEGKRYLLREGHEEHAVQLGKQQAPLFFYFRFFFLDGALGQEKNPETPKISKNKL
jgi:hypothetical protein